MELRKRNFSLWYLLAAVLTTLALQFYVATETVTTLAYSDFKALLKAGKVRGATVGETAISGTLATAGVETILPADQAAALQRGGSPERAFATARISNTGLLANLDAAHVRYAGQADARWLGTLLSWIVPALVSFAIWSLLYRRIGNAAGGLMEIGKSKARGYLQRETGVTFADVAGIDEAKVELMEVVVDFLKNPERYRRLGGKIPKGVLLLGAPGTGKTLLARAVTGEAGVPFFSMSGAEFVEMFVGVGAARVRDLFAQAEQKARASIFIDELDALGKTRTLNTAGGQDEREQTLNQLLVQMDGFDTNKGVIIMAATNRPEILDAALLRPGRFDRHIVLDRPDLKGREQILGVHVRHVKLAPEVNLRELAARTPGFAGADLANLVNEAALLAARHNKPAVDNADFNLALDRIVGGLEKRNRIMIPLEKQTIAHHEAGHALVAECRRLADRDSRISIIPHGVAALGFTQQTPTEDRYLLRRSELLDRLDVLLGGRAAGQIAFGDVSTGAQNDLERATDMARQMITQFGMSESLVPCYERARSTLLPSAAALSRPEREYSERTAQAIDEEIRLTLDQSAERARQTLLGQRARLYRLAQLLLEKEVVDRAALDALMQAGATAPQDEPVMQ
ncbi:Cell division-associated, ATP-dependent zinc metalloprotease FtsH (plasmid) [Cupriavidus necator H850]|uniref:ATP-dependent zinc metalloprotease FtsH n=1 Tax=Cupriavidus necator TaxID=106590 RepID=UPI00129EE5C6|nr:ATP-dependent zinc metalloprotease FtsH [Cupriavidus necator]KAI3603213.1 Cell division-associated, ATP-dependent zinc metalloprotease FtsH [Cupriavidus necator H850]